MDIQQTVMNIAQSIPGYLGYQSKDRRRENDRLVRRQLAAKFEDKRVRLGRMMRQAPIDAVAELENLDQKAQRLIARLNTSPSGYAGWFDAAQIGESDLDQITQSDAQLADGVQQFQAALDRIAAALKTKENIDDAIGAAADLLDQLNQQFDQREQFLAQGKAPSLQVPAKPVTSPLGALASKPAASAEIAALANLHLKDAVSYGGTDYLIAGKITYSMPTGSFWAYQLQDGGQENWLRVGPGNEIEFCRVVQFDIPKTLPETLQYQDLTLTRQFQGTANVTVEGAGGNKRGSVNYLRYIGAPDVRLWIENFEAETRVSYGHTVDSTEIKSYRR